LAFRIAFAGIGEALDPEETDHFDLEGEPEARCAGGAMRSLDARGIGVS
jgi:hypothetical protein